MLIRLSWNEVLDAIIMMFLGIRFFKYLSFDDSKLWRI